MITATAYSFRLKSRLAISLSWIAGYTNVITFVTFGGIVVSHVTGNVTHFGNHLAEGIAGGSVFGKAAFDGFLVATFLLGAICAGFMTEGARRRGRAGRYILPMAAEASLLLMLGLAMRYYVGAPIGPVATYWMCGVASLAMGLQNATITRISGAVVRTTHLTGVTTDLGLEAVQYFLWYRQRMRMKRDGRRGRVWRVSPRHPSFLRIALLMSIIGSFLFGVTAGTFAFHYAPDWALLLPVGFLLWIIYVDWRKPIAEVDELDLRIDPEFAGDEEIATLIPPGLGIYRLNHPRLDRPHHAPDFQSWVDRLPRTWHVVILVVSPFTHFDVDAVLDLRAALQKLRAHHRDIILCGVDRAQYKVLNKGGLVHALGMQNFCPDLDLALARGINRVQEMGGGLPWFNAPALASREPHCRG